MFNVRCSTLLRRAGWLLAASGSCCQQQAATTTTTSLHLAVPSSCGAAGIWNQALRLLGSGSGSGSGSSTTCTSSCGAGSSGSGPSTGSPDSVHSSTPPAAGGISTRRHVCSLYGSRPARHMPAQGTRAGMVLAPVQQQQQQQWRRFPVQPQRQWLWSAVHHHHHHHHQQQQQQWRLWRRAYTNEVEVETPHLTGLIRRQRSWSNLRALLLREEGWLTTVNILSTLKWLVKHPQEQPPPAELAQWLQRLVQRVVVEREGPGDCARLAYYCSRLGYVNDLGLYRALLQRFMARKGYSDPQDVSNMIYALGSQPALQGLLDQQVLVKLLQRLKQVHKAATPEDMCNGLWAAAKVAPQHTPALKVVVARLVGSILKKDKIQKAKPGDVSNAMYALARLPKAWHIDSVTPLVARLAAQLPQATPEEAATALLALGQYVEAGWMGVPSEPCMEAASQLVYGLGAGRVGHKIRRAEGKCVAVTPQHLADACWALAQLRRGAGAPVGQDPPWWHSFSTAVGAFAALLQQQPTPQQLTTRELVADATTQQQQATPQQVATVLRACGEVRHYPQQLLEALPAAAPAILQQATSHHIADIARALAVLAPEPPAAAAALMASLLQRAQDLLAQQPAAVNGQDLATTAWAVAVLDQQQLAGQLEPLAAAAFNQKLWVKSRSEALQQWQQVHLWLTDTQVLGPAGLGGFPGVSQQQLEQCREAWEKVVAAGSSKVPSQVLVLAEVVEVLSSMPAVEVVGSQQQDQQDGSRSIDIVARYQGQLLAVEVDGPQHFTWPGQRPTGDTLARNRALLRRGYRVVSVPVEPGRAEGLGEVTVAPSWKQQHDQQQQRQEYLQGLLDTAVEPAAVNT